MANSCLGLPELELCLYKFDSVKSIVTSASVVSSSGLLHPEADFRNQVDLASTIDYACFMKAIGSMEDGSKPGTS